MPQSKPPAATLAFDAELLDLIRRTVTTVVPEVDPVAITPDQTLADLGCNSVDRAEVMVILMSELAANVPPSEFSRDLTISAVITLLRAYG